MGDPMDVILDLDGGSWNDTAASFSIDGTNAGDLDNQTVSPTLIAEFNSAGVTLHETAIISVQSTGVAWFVADVSGLTAAIYILNLNGDSIDVVSEPNAYYIEDLKPGDAYVRGEAAPGPLSLWQNTVPVVFSAAGAKVGDVGSYDSIHLGPEVGDGGAAWWTTIKVEALVGFTRGPHFLCIRTATGVDGNGDPFMKVKMVGGAIVRGCRYAEDPGITTNSSFSDDWADIADYDPAKSWNYPGGEEGGAVILVNDFPFELPVTGGSSYTMYMLLGANGTIEDIPGGDQLYSNGSNNHRIYNLGLRTTATTMKANLASPPSYPGGSVSLFVMRLNGDPNYVSDVITPPVDDTGGGDDAQVQPALIVRNNVFSGGTSAITATGVRRVVFADNAARGVTTPIVFQGCNYPVVTGNTASLCSLALHLKDSYFASVTNNVFRDSGVVDQVVYLENTHHTHISENKIFNTDSAALPVHAVALNATCTNCAVVNNDFRRGFSNTRVLDGSSTAYEIRNLPEDGVPGGGMDGGAPVAAHTHVAGDITGFAEAVDDRVTGLLAEGTGIDLVYDDNANTLTITATPPTPSLSLDDLTDVTAPPAYLIERDVLRWNGTAWINDTDVISLDDVFDVDAPTPNDGDMLVWDNSAGAWINSPAGSVSTPLDGISDVDAAAPNDGDVLAFNSGTSSWVASAPAAGGMPWLPTLTAPVLGDFSWVSQGTATATAQYGGITLYEPGHSGTSACILKMATPTAPYTVTAAFIPSLWAAKTYLFNGICLRQSSNGSLQTLALLGQGGAPYWVSCDAWTSDTSYLTQYAAQSYVHIGTPMWLRIVNDNTDHLFYYSSDSFTWQLLYSASKTAFIVADQVGFFVDAWNTSTPNRDAAMHLVHWSIT